MLIALIGRDHKKRRSASGDDTGELLGVVTDRDMTARACAEDHALGRTAVSEIATREVLSCLDLDDLKVAEHTMREAQKSDVVVKDGYGAVVGVLSLTDIVHNDLRWRALETARSVLAREREVPHQPVDHIQITPSTPEDEDAAMKHETVHGGSWAASMKVFPS